VPGTRMRDLTRNIRVDRRMRPPARPDGRTRR
jgi:hypothetical protein